MMADFLMNSIVFIVSIFLCCLRTSSAPHSLKPGDVLNSTTQLCSESNKFCLQFYNDGDDGTFSYLAIYYNQSDDDFGRVWVGNRNEPVVNNSGKLTLDDTGELKIVTDQGKPVKVLYHPKHPINNTVATLSDYGNFILQQIHPNGSSTLLWQSFDYPTDTLLPVMKLGINHKTGHKWSLVSSMISYNDPTGGDFALEWEFKRRELIIRGREGMYWKSGLLRDNKSFENIPIEFIPNFKVVANEDEDYFTLTSPNSTEEVSSLYLASEGLLYYGTTEIATTDKCYGFNNDHACQLYDAPKCWHWQHTEAVYGFIDFTDIQNVKNDTNSSLTRLDCQRSCWNDCHCVGYSTIYNNRTGCAFLYKQGAFTSADLHPTDHIQLTFRLTEPSHSKGKSEKTWIWIVITIAASLFTVCLFILCLALRKRKFQMEEKKRQSLQTVMLDLLASNESTSVTDNEDDINKGHEVRIFSWASIMELTNGFSTENKLGEGGFGPVYKGVLPTGKEVAIKRLSKTSGQGVVEFKNELKLICELQHTNLVQLVGCCIHREERMLIYEFMPNKSLDFFLFDSARRKLLDWQKRLNIIEGIAQGLLYLHKYSRLKIIHRDLKTSNILLDENMNKKISDFGMARIFTQQESKANTHKIVGTYGYMSPEYAMEGVFSTKSDIYSFGVLLLEIVSGRRNNSFYDENCNGPLNLVGHAWELWKKDAILQLMDPTLYDSCIQEEVQRCIHIGILCVEENADDRPTISNIVSILTNKSASLSLPKRPATLYIRRNMIEGKLCSKESHMSSINKVSLTILDAR